MKLLIAGDTHSNLGWTSRLIDFASENGCDKIVQLGDFGFWPNEYLGKVFLHAVSRSAQNAGIPFYWIDGNHENHAMLNEMLPSTSADGFVEIADHLTYIPRSHVWEWAGVRIGALGGAFSIDHAVRVLGHSWFQEELITEENVRALVAKRPVDVLFTHEAPDQPPGRSFSLAIQDEAISTEQRRLVRQAAECSGAKLLFHGHWHRRYSWERNFGTGDIRIEGLAADVQADGRAWGILELPSLTFTGGDCWQS